MTGKPKGRIDPRTTRRRVAWAEFARNQALYAQYRVLGYEGVGPDLETPRDVVIELREEFCRKKEAQRDNTLD